MLGFTAGGELMLLGPRQPYQPCSAVLRVDLQAHTFTRYADSMFAADACAATGVADMRPQFVKLAPDGQLWAFSYDGLFVFEDGVWQPLECAGGIRVPNPDIAFDDDGAIWLIGGDESYLVRREQGVCTRVPLPSFTLPETAVHAFTPSGSLLINTENSVLEVTERGVIEYPPLPDGLDGVVDLASDRYGRPLVRANSNYLSLQLYRHEAGGWKQLGYSESVVNDAAFRVYSTMHGKVERIEGEQRLPVGPVSAHRSSLAGAQVLPPHLLTMDGDAIEVDWLRRTDRQPSGISQHVFAERTALAGASWQSESAELLDAPPDAQCRYEQPLVFRRAGEHTLLSCADSQLSIRDQDAVTTVAFEPAPAPYFFSEAQISVAADPAGSLYVAYIQADTRELHIGHLDAGAQLTLDYTVPGATMDTWVILHQTPMVDLAWTHDGLAVLWQGRASEDAAWERGGRLLANGTWSELPAPPAGRATVDHQGRLWLDGAESSQLFPVLWTGSEWQRVAGGPVAGGWAGRMIFDAADNPIVVASGGNGLSVLRHKDGQWRPVQGSDRPGGVTNSCSSANDPRLALDGDRLCVSWLETVERPFGVLLRCTRLLD